MFPVFNGFGSFQFYINHIYLHSENADGQKFAFMADLIAQLVEHLPFKERVLGSSPSQITDDSN